MKYATANTNGNNAKASALKKINQCRWVGNTTHNTLDKCLVALNLDSTNSGWYKPIAIRIPGLIGMYMVNQDGSIFCEARIIKEYENKFKIEYLTNLGWREFENIYSKMLLL